MMDLLAYLEGEPDNGDAKRLRAVADRLGDGVQFVDRTDDGDRTVGLLLVLTENTTDPDVEHGALTGVLRVVQALEAFTHGTDDVIAWELNGECVGWIEDGQRDDSMSRGLIEPWAEQIQIFRQGS